MVKLHPESMTSAKNGLRIVSDPLLSEHADGQTLLVLPHAAGLMSSAELY